MAGSTVRAVTRAHPWLRVSDLRVMCPVCGRRDWCMIASDGEAVICARIKSDKPAGTKGAGWLHQLDGAPLSPLPQPLQEPQQARKAAPSVLDATYTALLARLELSASHRDHLCGRGLADDEIQTLGYRTLPATGRRELVRQLEAQGIRLAGVPGFWLDGAGWHLAGPAGIAIPVRDTRRRILGLQIRCDRVDTGKYKWLSSKRRSEGCSPGVPIHCAGPVSIGADLWVVEGPLKGDIAALRLRRTVLAVAGVSNWPGILSIVRELQPRRLIVAYDMDKGNNPCVRLHLDTLARALLGRGLRVFEADWRHDAKGLDDLLMQGE